MMALLHCPNCRNVEVDIELGWGINSIDYNDWKRIELGDVGITCRTCSANLVTLWQKESKKKPSKSLFPFK